MSKIQQLIARTERALQVLTGEIRDPELKAILQEWLHYEADIGSSLVQLNKTCKELVRVGLTAQMRELLEAVEPFAQVGETLRQTYGVDLDSEVVNSHRLHDYIRAADVVAKYRGSLDNTDQAIISISVGDSDEKEST